MFIYNHNTLIWSETPNNVFTVKVLDNNAQILQTTQVSTNEYNFAVFLANINAQLNSKIIAINPIDEAGNETEPVYIYYLNNNKSSKNEIVFKDGQLDINLDSNALANVGFTLNTQQSITINTNTYQNKELEYYTLIVKNNMGYIVPPKYTYTPRGYPGYDSPQILEILLQPGSYVISINGKYL